ncbi:MAG: tRNA (adenosine(37)-N6)-threonylcarbamoyltransferase complex transferase subunit TsaD [Candidatus Dojkabacteria bacterium]
MNSELGKLIVLAIDTSCDDTSVAVVQGARVLSNVISSQDEIHGEWGGVVPDLARRAHNERIDAVIEQALTRASRNSGEKINFETIDAIAATYGPGLAIALEVGLKKAQALASEHGLPFVAVNHMEGHLLSALAQNSRGSGQIRVEDLRFPLLGLLISGGHTEIVLMKSFGDYEIVAQTLDDAVGEAYDKVARMLGLGYPGGKVLSEMAKLVSEKLARPDEMYALPIPLNNDDRLAFSYSGLKTAVYYKVKQLKESAGGLTKKQIHNFAASFEKAAISHLQQKLSMAIEKFQPKMILVGGGVASSAKVRAGLRKVAKNLELPIFFPSNNKLYVDNAAMIGVAGYFKLVRGELARSSIDRDPRASISKAA